jgi:DNA-binding response OmpR family regulator
METRRSIRNTQILSQGGTPSMSASLVMPRVLLAEDQAEMRSLLAKWLRNVGCEVVEFADGAALWNELLRAQKEEDGPRDADLIISDIRMPGPSGLEVLARLRRTDWATPVILMTAFGDAETVSDATTMGAARVFSKPFDMAELVAAALLLVDES